MSILITDGTQTRAYATLSAGSNNCGPGFSLVEETRDKISRAIMRRDGTFSGRLDPGVHHYCLETWGVRRPYEDNMCDDRYFPYKGMCISRALPSYANDMAACFGAKLSDMDAKCGGLSRDQVMLLTQKLAELPRPSLNTSNCEDPAYPVRIDNNAFSDARCAPPDAFGSGLIFNRYCDRVSGVSCVLREPPPPPQQDQHLKNPLLWAPVLAARHEAARDTTTDKLDDLIEHTREFKNLFRVMQPRQTQEIRKVLEETKVANSNLVTVHAKQDTHSRLLGEANAHLAGANAQLSIANATLRDLSDVSSNVLSMLDNRGIMVRNMYYGRW